MSQATNELPVGRIAGLFGVRGELKCDPTSSGRIVFSPGAALDLVRESGRQTVHLRTVREHKGRLLITLEGVADATAAERYVGGTFYASRDELDVAEGEYLDVDLVGCEVRTEAGRAFGRVERVEHFPASDMLIVGGRMLPMVKAFVRSIDTAGKRIVVDVPPGLLDDESESA